ncbi:EF-hand_domain [Hexamita inflata]|uniref:EF-hand domain n=1 Tax=Hexamita inflata TaxID=28002 RepID=A0AA86URU2_9EUKA|nr:EF-hand domain [Hexamita inflata]
MGGNASSKDEMSQIFKTFDTDGSGMIDRVEIMAYMKTNYPKFPLQAVDLLIMLTDTNGNGQIERVEFPDFYKIVQACVATDMVLKNIIYTALSVAENCEFITKAKIIKGLKCFGVIVKPGELYKNKYSKDEFMNEVEKMFE